jgi:hypothetical protein
MFSDFDIVNDGRCAFCKKILPSDVAPGIYSHRTCQNKCMKVMYYNREPLDWVLIRVKMHTTPSFEESWGFSIEIDKRKGDFFIVWHQGEEIILPVFDLFSHSLSSLESKIKNI